MEKNKSKFFIIKIFDKNSELLAESKPLSKNRKQFNFIKQNCSTNTCRVYKYGDYRIKYLIKGIINLSNKLSDKRFPYSSIGPTLRELQEGKTGITKYPIRAFDITSTENIKQPSLIGNLMRKDDKIKYDKKEVPTEIKLRFFDKNFFEFAKAYQEYFFLKGLKKDLKSLYKLSNKETFEKIKWLILGGVGTYILPKLLDFFFQRNDIVSVKIVGWIF